MRIFDEYLKTTIPVGRNNFTEIALDDTSDSIVLFYSTAVVKQEQREACKPFAQLAEIIRKKDLLALGKKLRVLSYDVNLHGYPEGINFEDRYPFIYIFPTTNKQEPFLKYTSKNNLQMLFTTVMEKTEIVDHKLFHETTKKSEARLKDLYYYSVIYEKFKTEGWDLKEVNERWKLMKEKDEL